MDSVDGGSRLDASAARLLSILDNPDDWDTAETQHIPLPRTCEETGTFAGAVLVSHAAHSSRKHRNREMQKPSQVSQTCGSRGRAQAGGTARNQPRVCRAVAEEQGASRRRTFLVCYSRKPSACTFAEPFKRVLLHPVWCCQGWGFR